MPTGADQDAVFRESEGDRWFQRNRAGLERYDAERDPVCRLLEQMRVQPASVVEIGAANGARVAALASRWKCDAVAVEPSAAAIADGQARHPHVRFVQATAAQAALGRTFDLVILHFVLHWVDRRHLARTVAAVDELVAPHGHLLIGDFHPPSPTKTRYHHRPDLELFTYKQDYGETFVALGTYRREAMVAFDHATREPSASMSDHDRASVQLLRKAPGELHAEVRIA